MLEMGCFRLRPSSDFAAHSNREPRAYRADGHVDDVRHLLIGHAFKPDEQDHLALF
jgi:hypothetical protein